MTARLLNIVGEGRVKHGPEAAFDLDAALAETVSLGASDLHVKPGCRPRVRIEGELNELPGYAPVNRDELLRIANAVMTSDMKQGVLEQEGSADLSYDAPCGRFRCSAFRQRGGTSYIFRTIPEAPDFDELGLPEVVLTWAGAPQGLVIVTGPTGSGKSTTSAALIRRINEGRSCHIVTVEDPIEFVHHDAKALVSQREIGPDAPSFSRALKAALRQDPDVILIGEIRDEDTAMTALRAAETGHLVFCTLHTSGAADTIARLMELFASRGTGLGRQMLASSMVGIISQRLVRGMDGRRRCNAEVLVNTARMRDCLTDGADASEIQQIMAEGDYYGMQTFDQSLLDLVARGEVRAAEGTSMAINPHNFRLELAQLDGSTDVLGTGLRPKK
ncbi:MAG: twitching motility protein PilT [Thermoleophilaceae bacterium]|jgi:twitching motility protein PilT|nr:twitching motility protein PilT [Thermoleophilaceae bacterium]